MMATQTSHQFTPATKSIINLIANQTVNFLVKLYKISRCITLTGSTMALSDVTVMITSPTPAGFTPQTAQTGMTGYYTFGTNLPAGRDYIIEPSKPGYTFGPPTQIIMNLSDDISALEESANFTRTGP